MCTILTIHEKMRETAICNKHIFQGEGEDATVKRIEHLGDQTRLHLDFKNHHLITVTEAHTLLKSGDNIKIQPKQPYSNPRIKHLP